MQIFQFPISATTPVTAPLPLDATYDDSNTDSDSKPQEKKSRAV